MEEYLLSLISISVLCGIVSILTPNGDSGKYISFLCGICVLCVMLGPITSVLDESKELAEIIEDSIYDTDEEYYDAIFKEYLKDGSEEEISSFLKSKMSEELNIDPKKFGVSVFLEERQNNFCVQKAVVTIFSSGIALDAKEMSEYLTELLGCSCVIVYE